MVNVKIFMSDHVGTRGFHLAVIVDEGEDIKTFYVCGSEENRCFRESALMKPYVIPSLFYRVQAERALVALEKYFEKKDSNVIDWAMTPNCMDNAIKLKGARA